MNVTYRAENHENVERFHSELKKAHIPFSSTQKEHPTSLEVFVELKVPENAFNTLLKLASKTSGGNLIFETLWINGHLRKPKNRKTELIVTSMSPVRTQ
ncbi:hypothetical protein [Reinekea sp. G2M2-21]|uniref:hypothetical protein n=1 Tax=Reinekea sp. G2M2-21 TaxID=2788942 RepID=UPI0018A9EFAA|nr:hypothetical protein [Reinekea sp. G2M2-21]